MAPARPARRAVTNENDENAATTRVTRAKAAALSVPSDGALPAKKALQAKKAAVNVQSDNQPRKRAALGDVTNAGKGDVASRTLDAKKPAVALATSKTAQTSGTQKLARQNSTRTALVPKDSAATGTVKDLKRPASIANATSQPPKKRASLGTGQRPVRETSPADDENVEPEREEVVEIVEKTVTETTRYSNGVEKVKHVKTEKVLDAAELARQNEIEATIESMDDEDAGDPLMVAEYAYEIFDYMRTIEESTMANPEYMDGQDALEWHMRGVLVDWLLEVHTRFHLLPETFYLTVNIIDRFLSMKKVELDRLQLVGVTAMFIASKYEEVLSPHIGNFVHVADDGFTEAEILSAERFILSTLNFDLSCYPNPMHFVRRISKADNYDIQTRTLAKFLLEITLFDHRFLKYKPSINAAASMFLSRLILEKGEWDAILEHYSGYTEEEIIPVVNAMIRYLRREIEHQAFYKKYAGKRFLKASLHARAWAKKYMSERKSEVSVKSEREE